MKIRKNKHVEIPQPYTYTTLTRYKPYWKGQVSYANVSIEIARSVVIPIRNGIVGRLFSPMIRIGDI